MQHPSTRTGPVPSRCRALTRSLGAAVLLMGLAIGSAAPTVAQQQGQPSQHQSPAGGSGGGQPVEIVADSLTVEQERRLATFTGNVDAVQGDLRLRADKLFVHYDQGEEGGPQAAQPAGQQGSIRRIEAVGNVFVTQPGETAQGDRGTYEPGSGAMTLEGEVVLTRDQNVIRGARLESNERTGVSTVFAAAPGTARKPDQRVRALFGRQGGAAAPAQGGAGRNRDQGGSASATGKATGKATP